jgi:REP element-mobilizing transposase RayT
MPQSYTSLLYHIVFSTKDRFPFLAPEWRGRLYAYLGGILRERGGDLLEINGTNDHVHLLLRLHQEHTLAQVVRDVKAASSGWIHREFPRLSHFAWQRGYGAFTVSASQLARVRRYIQAQEEHHRRRTFQEEFIALLKAHGIEYDEQHLWG